MKHRYYLVLLLATFSCFCANAAGLYMRSFGDAAKPAIIFLHGGPGYNCAAFEMSTAAALADAGYFVVVYDQRGCARSSGDGAKYTFEEAVNDLQAVYDAYHLKHASLLGHSFGGAVALRFVEAHPDEVSHLILLSAPLDYPATFKTILAHCRAYYQANSPANLKYMDMLDTMNTATLAYASYTFMNALNCKLYYPKDQTKEAADMYSGMKKDTLAKYLIMNSREAVSGFYTSEHYTTLTFFALLQKDMPNVKISGIFGAEDGLFDDAQRDKIKELIGADNFHLIKGASHNVFLDQRTGFIKTVRDILR